MEKEITQTMRHRREWRFLWCYLALGLLTGKGIAMESSITPSLQIVNVTASSVPPINSNASLGTISSPLFHILEPSTAKTQTVASTLSSFIMSVEPTSSPTFLVTHTTTLLSVNPSTTNIHNQNISSVSAMAATSSELETFNTISNVPTQSYITTPYVTQELVSSLTTYTSLQASSVINHQSVSGDAYSILTSTPVLAKSSVIEEQISSNVLSPSVAISITPTLIESSKQLRTDTSNVSKIAAFDTSTNAKQQSITPIQTSVPSINIEISPTTTGSSQSSDKLSSSPEGSVNSKMTSDLYISPLISVQETRSDTPLLSSSSQTYTPVVLSQTTGLYSTSDAGGVVTSSLSTVLSTSISGQPEVSVTQSVITTNSSTPVFIPRPSYRSAGGMLSSTSVHSDLYSSQILTASLEYKSSVVSSALSTSLMESASSESVETPSVRIDTEAVLSTPLFTPASGSIVSSSFASMPSSSSVDSVSISPTSSKENIQTGSPSVSTISYTSVFQNATVRMSTPAYDSTTLITPKFPTKAYVPVVAVNLSFEIEFEGLCDPLVQRKIVLEEFWGYLVVAISRMLLVERVNIKPKDIACNPIRITFTILEIDHPNITHVLTDFVAEGKFRFQLPVILEDSEAKFIYTAKSIKIVPTSYDLSGGGERYELGLSEVDIIVIISACCISVILICVGCCICVREYYLRKRSRSFDLSDIVNFNLKLEDYTLTKIPRTKPFYSDGGVKMQSFTRKNGHQAKALLDQDDNSTDENINENGHLVKDLQVRMNEHSDGILIGITKSNLQSVSMNSNDLTSCDLKDQSKQVLYEHHASPTHCMDNPIYFADDDRFSKV